MKKKILIVGWRTGDNSFGTTIPYLNYFTNKFGEADCDVRILMPTDTEVVDGDLLILPGGMDILPTVYGQVPSYNAGHVDVFKQHFYDEMLPKYVESGMPILGICLGMQQLAVFFGSDFTQHLYKHPYSAERNEKAHDVWLTEEAMKITGFKPKDGRMPVNSLHHQCVTTSQLSKELTIYATSMLNEDGLPVKEEIVEAFAHNTLPIYGIQWHPEEMRDAFTKRLIARILNKEHKKVVVPTGAL